MLLEKLEPIKNTLQAVWAVTNWGLTPRVSDSVSICATLGPNAHPLSSIPFIQNAKSLLHALLSLPTTPPAPIQEPLVAVMNGGCMRRRRGSLLS